MKYDKRKALNVITSSAKIFDETLKDKELLFISKQDKKIAFYEIRFVGSNFKHFTGVDSKLSANRFYMAAMNRKLSEKDFSFKDPFLVEKKMNILENAVNLPYTARMIGDFNYAGIKIQADVAGGNTSFTMAFRDDGKNMLCPVSVLQEDIRKFTKATSPIVAILSKKIGDKHYGVITYISKNINISNLRFPKEIKEKLSESAYHTLKH